MIPNSFKAVAFAALAAATLAASAAPAQAFTLSSTSPAASVAGANIDHVFWRRHWGWGGGYYYSPHFWHRTCGPTPWGWRCRVW